MDAVIAAIRQQAVCASRDAARVAVMLREGYSDREIRNALEIDTTHLTMYKTWIANALETYDR